MKGEVPDGELVDPLGTGEVAARREATARSSRLRAMVPRALEAAGRLAAATASRRTVVDVRSLVPLDTQTILARDRPKTGRLFTVEENPRLCGWGAEIVSIVAEELLGTDLDGPIVRITTPHSRCLRRRARGPRDPSVERIVETVEKALPVIDHVGDFDCW